MSALMDRLMGRSTVAPLAVSGLQLVPRGAVALAEHVNRYYRVLTGADAQHVAIRLPTGGGTFQVLNSATGAPVFSVNDAGVDVQPGAIGNSEIADGAVNSAKIADGSIMDADVNGAAGIQLTKLQAISPNNVLVGNAPSGVTARQVVNGDVDPAAAIAKSKLAALAIVNADVAAGAAIALAKLAPGAPGLLRSDGATITAGNQVASADIADGTIVNADVNASAAIAISKLQAISANNVLVGNGSTVTARQVVNGDVDPAAAIAYSKLALANSIVSGDIANNTIVDADIAPTAAIGVGKLYGGGTPARVVATADGVNVLPQTVATGMIATDAVTQIALVSGVAGDPTTTSTTAVDLPDMAITLTTVGGDLVCSFVGAFSNTNLGAAVIVELALDGGAQVAAMLVGAPVAGYSFLVTTMHVYTGVAAGPHTVKARWRVTAGTATASGSQRRLLVTERKK